MGIIALGQMEFWAYHGCFEEEQVIGTRFMVDLELSVDTSRAEKTDHLHDTVNYQAVYRVVKKEMETSSKLLEHLGRRILEAIHSKFPSVTHAKIKIAKLNPPLGGKIGSVSITLMDEYGCEE
ncbi:MAG: 7,8-dihydroneopterin aldolase/epimerase/oxygenase [Bacteroidales bacterium]|jgi:dihydroneopterin aldolase|nr:7,8-dihydroneopterin aldolase/epimerase/oxygenase [Bacteroidales bacterium]MDN5328254.1 7,8-dihydroneopterin aldolase/epimerase/oxygenase [Bacteroidales bacterium]